MILKWNTQLTTIVNYLTYLFSFIPISFLILKSYAIPKYIGERWWRFSPWTVVLEALTGSLVVELSALNLQFFTVTHHCHEHDSFAIFNTIWRYTSSWKCWHNTTSSFEVLFSLNYFVLKLTIRKVVMILKNLNRACNKIFSVRIEIKFS
jgi:hypothetical protein